MDVHAAHVVLLLVRLPQHRQLLPRLRVLLQRLLQVLHLLVPLLQPRVIVADHLLLLVPEVLEVDVDAVGALVVDLFERLEPGLVVLLLLLGALLYLLVVLLLLLKELAHRVALLLDPLRLRKHLVRVVPQRLLRLLYLRRLQLIVVPQPLLDVVQLHLDLVLLRLQVRERQELTLAAL